MRFSCLKVRPLVAQHFDCSWFWTEIPSKEIKQEKSWSSLPEPFGFFEITEATTILALASTNLGRTSVSWFICLWLDSHQVTNPVERRWRRLCQGIGLSLLPPWSVHQQTIMGRHCGTTSTVWKCKRKIYSHYWNYFILFYIKTLTLSFVDFLKNIDFKSISQTLFHFNGSELSCERSPMYGKSV